MSICPVIRTGYRATVLVFILFISINSKLLFASDRVATTTHIKELESPLSIAGFLDDDQRLKIFSKALKSSDVWSHVRDGSEETLFVITDAALRIEGSAFLLEVVLLKAENTERLKKLMAYHFLPGEAITINELSRRDSVLSYGEGCIPITVAGDSIQIGLASFITETARASNGYIHFVDRLLWQPYEDNHPCSLSTSR